MGYYFNDIPPNPRPVETGRVDGWKKKLVTVGGLVEREKPFGHLDHFLLLAAR